MRVPRILLVDDERQVSRMLRSCLELSGLDCIVVDVPSGEEAVIELGRGPVDLLVTDLKLPGISGLELLLKMRQLNPEARSILITGHPSEEARAQAQALGVVAFLPKPIRTNFFLEAVDRALSLSRPPELPVKVHEEGRAAMAEHLMAVLGELGAAAAYLVDEDGQLVVQAGYLGDVDLKSALTPLTAAFRAGLKVSGLLGALLPSNFQYFDGDAYDVYLTNVGSFYGLLIVFDGKQDPSRMGSIIRLGRKAADDMLSALSRMAPAEPLPPGTRGREKEPQPPASEEAGPVPDLDSAARQIQPKDAEEFWSRAASSGKQEPGEDGAITYDQARKLGLISDKPEG
jgi:CheY-like chemotaxis protein